MPSGSKGQPRPLLWRAGRERADAHAKFEAAGEIYRRLGAAAPWLERVDASRRV